jgi:hypothetical protein
MHRYYTTILSVLTLFLLTLTLPPLLTAADETLFGGITFLGDRQGICVRIEGQCAAEAIDFELATCDENLVEKEKFKERMPFTLLVPVGTHKLVVKKDGKEIKTDQVVITASEVLEYKLP